MISPQPIHLARYLNSKRGKVPVSTKRLFYMSWEDALWDVLEKKHVEKRSYVLVPEFFCGDVESNIISHGYKICHYPVNKDLTSDSKILSEKIKFYNPKVVVILDAVGIKNKLFESLFWMRSMGDDAILIEDSVHRVVNAQDIMFYRKNHFVIDSLRKVVPLQGSCLYGRKEDINFWVPPVTQSWFYSLKVVSLWLLMNLLWHLSMNRIAEKIMTAGYDVIGDAKRPARGWLVFDELQRYLDFKKIYETNRKQVGIYEKELLSLLPVKITYSKKDKKELRGWPIILDLKYAQKVLDYIRAKGLIIRFELNDSKWSKKQKIIYLPLGPYFNYKQQIEVCRIVKNAILQI